MKKDWKPEYKYYRDKRNVSAAIIPRMIERLKWTNGYIQSGEYRRELIAANIL